MARRRSARLASASKASKSTPTLASVNEGNEGLENDAPSLHAIVASPAPAPRTPGNSSPAKPSLAEMHPSLVHDRHDREDMMTAPSPAPATPGKLIGIKPPLGEMHPSKVHDKHDKLTVPSPAPRTPGKSSPIKPPMSEMHPSKVHDRHTGADVVSAPSPAPKTPGKASGIKPPMSEMHPSKVHNNMAAPSSSLRLGFTDIKPATGRSDLPAAVQSTPTKVGIRVPSGDFTFRFTRQATDLQLGPEAQRMMEELREEALKIKQDLVAKREAEREEEEKDGRKFAKPKGKASRYSAAHMAEFKKMDSIENHPSAFRAQPGRSMPAKTLKRTQSKANLDSPKATAAPSSSRPKPKSDEEAEAPAKRVRQRLEDDTSSARPVSRDGSNIPRPKSSAGVDGLHRARSNASLMTPTKSSMARAAAAKTPSASAIKAPSMFSGMKRTATAKSAYTDRFTRALSPNITVRSPSSRFGKALSFLRGEKFGADKSKSSIPLASDKAGTTPSSSATLLDKPLPSLPAATPGRTAPKRVAFTPETKRVLDAETTPSPVKSAIPRSTARKVLGEVHYPTLDTVMAGDDFDTADGDVSYPDLSGARPLPEPPARHTRAKGPPAPPPASAPGTFTFRSDQTISFSEASPNGFGASPNHATIRQVRPSILPTVDMPGSFPTSITSPINKENEAPASPSGSHAAPAPLPVFKALPHGIVNKKRHRVSSDEEDAEQEAAERAAKKRKNDVVPEGEALLAPRLMASPRKPSFTPAKRFGVPTSAPPTPSPKKKAVLSLSRLNMLARPKNRK